MKKYNIHAASLGNNHGYDYGEEGLKNKVWKHLSKKVLNILAQDDIEEAKNI